MKWKTTLILFVIAAGVFAYLFFIESNRPGTEEAARQSQNVLNFSREKIDGVVIHNGDDMIDIRRRDYKWRLETPIRDQADASLVNNLLLDLESWQKDAAISAKEMEADKSKLADYGLANPKLRLKLLGPGAPPEVFFGKDAALEGKMYVRFENSKETFLASQSVKKALEKKPEDFRDRKLTDLIMAQVVRVVLKTSAGEMELQKKGDHWEIAKPLHTRADDQKVNDLIAQVTTARIQQFVANRAARSHFLRRTTSRARRFRSAAFPKKRKTRFTCASLRAASFTRCQKKSTRRSTTNLMIFVTATSFESTQKFSTG